MEFSIIVALVSFIAGVLTVFAPCIFAFLPIILRGVEAGNSIKRSSVIIGSLSLSIFFFSLLLRSTTLLISIPTATWEMISGIILISQGILILLPTVWATISHKLRLDQSVVHIGSLQKKDDSLLKDVLIGISLGPIFSSCSPTYAYIIGVMLPATLITGIAYLSIYILGVATILLSISLYGNSLLRKYTNPKGIFKLIVGWVILIMGILIFFGWFKDIEAFIIRDLPFLDITRIDGNLLRRILER